MRSSGKKSPNDAHDLSLVITHFLATNSLVIFMSEDLLLNRMLMNTWNTNNSHEQQKRSPVAERLLDACYGAYQKQKDFLAKLLTDVRTYGHAIYGDGATINKIPLINIVAHSANNLNCALDVNDCSDPTREGVRRMHGVFAKSFASYEAH